MISKEFTVSFDVSDPIRLWPLPVVFFTLRVNKGRRMWCLAYNWKGKSGYWWL